MLYVEQLVFAAIYDKSMWVINTSDLRDDNPNGASILGPKTISDGIIADAEGNIYITDFEHNSIAVLTSDGASLSTVVRDKDLLRWPDGIAISHHGSELFVACSAIHEVVAGDHETKAPFHLLRIVLPAFSSEL